MPGRPSQFFDTSEPVNVPQARLLSYQVYGHEKIYNLNLHVISRRQDVPILRKLPKSLWVHNHQSLQ